MRGGPSRIAWSVLFACLSADLAACSRPTSAPIHVFRRPVGVAVTCSDTAGNPVPVSSCTSSSLQTAWVLDADRSGVGILSLADGVHLDTDAFLPGFNPLAILDGDGEVLPDLVEVRAAPDSDAVYVLSRRGRTLVRVSPRTLEQTLQSLPCEATSFDFAEDGPLAPAALVACPDPPGIAIVPLDDFGATQGSSLPMIAMSGRPLRLDATGDGTLAFVTHDAPDGKRLGYLSRVDLAAGTEDRLPLLPECSDGLDNDGDGWTDHEDPGCEGPDDDSEDPDRPGPCEDGVDNDADERVDAEDPDCGPHGVSEFPLVPWPACANGRDDDGDGLADWPADPDCYGPAFLDEGSPPPRTVGRPAVTPDGRFVYVPMTPPAAIAVFEATPLRRVDVNALDGPSPNVLLHRLGIRDILLTSPVVGLAMVRGETGTRAFAGLASGQVLSIQVDQAGEPVHRLETEDGVTVASSTSLPVVRVRGARVGTLDEVSSEYPTFGSNLVAPVPGAADQYSYYGITFGGRPEQELPETWRVTFEGVIPGAASETGFYDPGAATLRDPYRDFCTLGVEPGDHVVLTSPPAVCLASDPTPPGACPEVAGGLDGLPPGLVNLCEYRVAGVGPDRLVLEEVAGGRGLDVLAGLPGPVPYEVRVAEAWTVVGSRSGFLHNRVSAGDHCEERADSDLRFTGRATTSLPPPGAPLPSCPVREGASGIVWSPFTNPAFTFRIFPPCRTGEDLRAEACRLVRDTEVSFGVAEGRAFRVAATGGFPVGLQVVGSRLVAVDPVFGAVHVVDWGTMTLLQTLY